MLNNNIAQHYKGYELFIKQLLEGIQRYQRNRISIPFGFIGLDKFEIVHSILDNEVPYTIIKSNEESLIGRLIIGENVDKSKYVKCLHGYINKKFGKITHKDLLGALSNSGLSSDVYGEMWVDNENFYIICTPESANYLLLNLTQISRYKIELEIIENIPERIVGYETFNIISSSYRLDSVVSEIIHLSRNKTQDLINKELVNVNFKVIKDSSFLLKDNNIISIRGYGRYKISKEITQTKSLNYVIEIKKYI